MTANLAFSLERTVLISARRATVFRYFTDSRRFAEWWGPGSSIEARPGGDVSIRYPGGVVATGKVLEIVDGERIVFTYGYEAPGKPIPPGGSRVTITLAEGPEGTLLTLRHEVADAAARDAHDPGWRYQMAIFANLVAREEHAGAAAVVDDFFAAWNEPDPALRREAIERCAAPGVIYRDGFAALSGIEDLLGHIGACRIHMPGVLLSRSGDPRQCQGTALASWVTRNADGSERKGWNIFDFAPDGRIRRVVGLSD